MIDLHCHILPGLDDGPPTMDVALEMCRIAAADGVRTIVATPHMLNGMYEVTPEAVFRGVGDLSRALSEKGIRLDILPGSDVHVHAELPAMVERGEVLTVAGRGRHLMVELPQDVFPGELKDLLFRIQLKGITPLISHPERNVAIQQNPALLSDLIEGGSLTQITAGSLAGSFGAHVQKCALRLLQLNMIHVVASDAHNTARRSPRLSEAFHVVKEEKGEGEAGLLFLERPGKILAGSYVEPPEPLGEKKKAGRKRGLLGRFFSS